jgi:elongation factor P
MLAKEIKTGAILVYEGAPVIIQTIHVQTPSARGAATLYKYRARNLVTRQKLDIVLKGTDSLEEADFQRRPIKLMYAEPEQVHFLDQNDFNQYTLAREDIAEELPYITESLEEGFMALIYNGECVGLQLPTAVELAITYCEPAVKGDSATKRPKPATLETGLVVQVPDYISQGERVKVDTRSGEFLGRA